MWCFQERSIDNEHGLTVQTFFVSCFRAVVYSQLRPRKVFSVQINCCEESDSTRMYVQLTLRQKKKGFWSEESGQPEDEIPTCSFHVGFVFMVMDCT